MENLYHNADLTIMSMKNQVDRNIAVEIKVLDIESMKEEDLVAIYSSSISAVKQLSDQHKY